jgi:hypothetical protein
MGVPFIGKDLSNNKDMTNLTPKPNPDTKPVNSPDALASPLKCLSAALISGGFAIALYFLTSSIARSFAAKPLASTNPTAINIAIAVRTLVVGVSTLATFVFSFIAVGLLALGLQSVIQQLKNKPIPPSDAQ